MIVEEFSWNWTGFSTRFDDRLAFLDPRDGQSFDLGYLRVVVQEKSARVAAVALSWNWMGYHGKAIRSKFNKRFRAEVTIKSARRGKL